MREFKKPTPDAGTCWDTLVLSMAQCQKGDALIIHGRGILDGAKTMDEMIFQMRRFILFLEDMRNQGWVLSEPFKNDDGCLRYMPK